MNIAPAVAAAIPAAWRSGVIFVEGSWSREVGGLMSDLLLDVKVQRGDRTSQRDVTIILIRGHEVAPKASRDLQQARALAPL